MGKDEEFTQEVQRNIDGLVADSDLQALSRVWVREVTPHRYAYNFRWMGRPIIQFPQDMVAMQEIIWSVRPDVIIETGVAHGGSLVYYASLLELMGKGRVIGVDIEIRPHNRAAIESHPMAKRIDLVEGSSTSAVVVQHVRQLAAGFNTAIVVLDSNHTHDHVLEELRAYAPFVSVGSYCVVMDTIIEDMPKSFFPDRAWSVGNNPKTAVKEYLQEDPRFQVDLEFPAKLLITVAPDGYLKRVR